MHVHSTASELSKLGVQRALALPECATPPEEVYTLAKRRGMDFVTITDHDTIAGALTLAHLPDTFISEELTAWFRGEAQAVHILCYGITSDDHDWLQAHNRDVEACAEYLHGNGITAALAHPFYHVAAPLTPRHRRRLAQLFPIWETRNGSRARELNLPAFVYIETHGGTAIGGSDDHAGIDIGRTYTETPPAATPEEFLAHIGAGRADSRGDQGSAAKWTHAAMALAIRSLGARTGAGPIKAAAVLEIVERLMREGDDRQGQTDGELGPEDALALLRAWLAQVHPGTGERELLEILQEGSVDHQDLSRRARRIHERRLAGSLRETSSRIARGELSALPEGGRELFEACLPVIPYVAAGVFLHREQRKLRRTDGDRPRIALVADGLGSVHGVSRTVEQIRERGVPGHDVEVIGTDADVDRRLSAVAELEVPFYPGLTLGVPSLSAVADAIADGRYDLLHVCAPGPAGVAAWALARMLDLPILGSYHTELGAYAAVRSGHTMLQSLADAALRQFYGACGIVLSPSACTDTRVESLGVVPGRIRRWARGVDLDRFGEHHRSDDRRPGEIRVLYSGRLTREKGVDLLADAFLAAHRRDSRLHLVLAGGGPEEETLRQRLGEAATFLGWLGPEALPQAYANADVFLFASRTDTFGQVILEAQASGLPVVAVAEGGPTELIESGESGLLVAPEPETLAEAVLAVSSGDLLRERLRRGGLAAVARRTWATSMGQLARGYEETLWRAQADLDEVPVGLVH